MLRTMFNWCFHTGKKERKKKRQYFESQLLLERDFKSKQGASKFSVRAAQCPHTHEMGRILKDDLPTRKRLMYNSGEEGIDCVRDRTGKKEKKSNKKNNKFV